MRDKKCEELIDQELKKRIGQIKEILEEENEEEREIKMNDYLDGILAITEYRLYKIELSYGGPQDYFEILVDKDTGEIVRGTYYYLDWFDGANRLLKEEDLEVIEEIFGEYFKY